MDLIITIFRNVVDFDVTSGCEDLALATEDFQSRETTSLRTLAIISPHKLFVAVYTLAHKG